MIIALVFAERNMSYFLVLQKYGLNFRTRGSKDIWKIPMKGNLVRDQRHKWKRENEKKTCGTTPTFVYIASQSKVEIEPRQDLLSWEGFWCAGSSNQEEYTSGGLEDCLS